MRFITDNYYREVYMNKTELSFKVAAKATFHSHSYLPLEMCAEMAVLKSKQNLSIFSLFSAQALA